MNVLLAGYERALHAGDFSVFAFSYICMPYALINSTCMLCDPMNVLNQHAYLNFTDINTSIERGHMSAMGVSISPALRPIRPHVRLKDRPLTRFNDFIKALEPRVHSNRAIFHFIGGLHRSPRGINDCLTLATSSLWYRITTQVIHALG